MLSVYSITDQNIYFSFCLMILVYYMKLTNVITKLSKMGRAVLASPFFCMWIHLIETAMCLTGFSLGQNNSLLKMCSPLLLDISTATAVSPLSVNFGNESSANTGTGIWTDWLQYFIVSDRYLTLQRCSMIIIWLQATKGLYLYISWDSYFLVHFLKAAWHKCQHRNVKTTM